MPAMLYLVKTWQVTWEQYRPGGCRCLCQLYHHGDGTCTAAAEPGHLLRVVTTGDTWPGNSTDITDALPLCAPCYTALVPLTRTTETAEEQGNP